MKILVFSAVKIAIKRQMEKIRKPLEMTFVKIKLSRDAFAEIERLTPLLVNGAVSAAVEDKSVTIQVNHVHRAFLRLIKPEDI